MVHRDEIEAAVKKATGDPDTGVVRDITPAIVDAVDALVNGGSGAGGKGGKAKSSDEADPAE